MKLSVLALTLIPSIAFSQSQATTVHEHGTGHVVIAMAGAEFSLSLVVPGVDIVGFEGPAETDDDRARVAVAISDLSNPLELFVLPEAAGCFAASANVTLSGETLGQDVDAAQEVNHTEFQADYQIQCQDIDALDGIEFAYFDRFPKAKRLKIQVSRSGDARSQEVTSDQRNLAF
ncbi:ZrgA family zinc uptake protein [Ruegeria meonggei]|uniref:DUF2796 domain-containing protein n=1 Tax=Ruegeria meonggei TaxID=1446476 RepID=A0A1X6ZYJ5_9RHOB|nr:DUF2796 domain-containing protein [Ruegeria meonggei]SLN65298.1 hypothetical protein RUM8411_03247 [Ruegeria meonggei]